MPAFQHDSLPIHEVPRIKTRVLVGEGSGAKETEVWEQWIDPEGYIPLHYHNVEEVLVVLAGKVVLTLGDETSNCCTPVTILVPAGQVHGLRPAYSEPVHLLGFFPVASPKIFAPDGTLRPLPWQDQSCEEKGPP